MEAQIINLPAVVAATEAKSLYDNAKESLNLWETAINKTTVALDKLNSGDQHLSVYQALRDVVIFSAYCMDNPKEAAPTFKEWAEHEPERKNTNPYAQPVNLIFDRAGVLLESINNHCKRCEWAAIARYLHPMITAGTIDDTNFVSFIEAKGGIRATYDSIPKTSGKGRKPKASGDGGGKSGDGAKNVVQPNFNKNRKPKYVVVVFDVSQTNAYKDAAALGTYVSRMDEFVLAREGSFADLDGVTVDDADDGVTDEAA